MPIMQVHIETSAYSRDQLHRFLVRISRVYAEVLESPIERIRVLIHDYPPDLIAIGGKVTADTGETAPFFEAFLLEGRPLAQQHAVLAKATDVIVECLGARRDLVRGVCHMVPPERWGIAGLPAASLRSAEITERNNHK
ncbi:MAG: tautomerase family protein [Halieaceae bacterium]|nr:tautomerase family protein [Halieaceae bacterium]